MATPYGSVPSPGDTYANRGYGVQETDFVTGGTSALASPAGQHSALTEDMASVDGGINRSASTASTAVGGVSRNNTLKKKSSFKRSSSVKRSGSKKSLRAGSLRSVQRGVDPDDADFHSVFSTPVPTTGAPTEVLANRFQAWRQLLKSLITYFREIQNSYDARAKAIHKVQNTISNVVHPSVFMTNGGLGDATRILTDFHKHSIVEAQKSRDIEDDVIGALSGLRSDLGQKIKEIKGLSGDFKNSVEKEKDVTRREIEKLQDALQHADHEDALGKNDPYVVRLGVDRAIEKQIDEENYLHRAYLNLESSGRELEAIVVGEIQKAYNALAGILKREGDDAYNAVEALRAGPIALPKDQEWYQFVTSDPHFVDPGLPLRRIEDISYPGKNHPQATEIRAGMLERKSKYLKSYTPGWYVLSATHLHEFKSADKIYSQPPVMSLYLLDQKLGSHSERASSSHKFMLKGKQSGSMHKGHNWVFRAESYETMLAWFEDIRNLTEKTGEERIAFVRKHARSVSGTSDRSRSATLSSDGLEDDDADQAPYSADVTSLEQSPVEQKPVRPQPGGRFPSDMVLRKTGTMTSDPNSSDSDDQNMIGAAGVLAGSAQHEYGGENPYRLDGVRGSYDGERHAALVQDQIPFQGTGRAVAAPAEAQYGEFATQQQPAYQPAVYQQPSIISQQQQPIIQHQQHVAQQQQPAIPTQQVQQAPPASSPNTASGDWALPAAGGVAAGVGAGFLGTEVHKRHQRDTEGDVSPVSPIDERELPAAAAVAPPGSQNTTIPSPSTYAAVPISPTTTQELAEDAESKRGSPGIIALDDSAIPITSLPSKPSFGDRNNIDDILSGSSTPAAGLSIPTPATAAVGNAAATTTAIDIATPTTTATVSGSDEGLGGNERVGAHETGQLFPRVIRHDTSLSVSALHVPGEFPAR